MMLIRNTVFVDFTDYSAAFLQSKLSVLDECRLTESTSKPLIDNQIAFFTLVIEVMVKPSGFNAPETDAVAYIHTDIPSVILK